jgi:asparagine synthase (glutamine-hydrolysing)
MLFSDQRTYMVELLMKQDRMSMATSIESRAPFLDHTFVEFAMRLPDRLKLPRRGKYVFKKAVEDTLPREIVYRPKMGFPTPLRTWLSEERSAFLHDYILDPGGLVSQYLDTGQIRPVLERHRRRQEDATHRIWRLLTLQVWGDVFLTGRKVDWLEQSLGKS